MRDERALPLIFSAGVAGCAIGWWLQVSDGYAFLVYLLVVFAAAVVAYPHFGRRSGGALTAELYAAALAVKLAASAARYWTVTGVYGRGDALRYDQAGAQIAEALRLGERGVLERWWFGTTAMEFLAGFVYALLPQSIEGAFLLFSFLAFLGSLFFLLAFVAALPRRSPHGYAAVVLFLPSIAFWPSSLGKDAVIFLGFGMACYGVARQWVQHAPHGILYIAAGLGLVVTVRPHAAALFVIACCAAALWSLLGPARGLAVRLAGLALVGALGYLVLDVNADFLFGREIEELSASEVAGLYQHRQESTRAGGSALEAPSTAGALAPLVVAVTVLFRPFPWEVANAAMAVTAAENLLLLGFLVARRRRLWESLKGARGNMLLALCLCLTLGVMAFLSGTSNLGIIARQRVQFLPCLFMMLL